VRLVQFSVGALEEEARSIDDLCSMLLVAAPVSWPPPFSDDAVRDWFLRQLRDNPDKGRWLGAYVIAAVDGVETLVGTAGYKGPPDATGTVEIGYSVVEAHHRRGIGTEVVRELVSRAFGDARVLRVTAETPLSFEASRGLLEKSGFRLAGQRTDPEEGELALYEIVRSQ
jgi:RimJ/RimL family protein N-acetyltransferase